MNELFEERGRRFVAGMVLVVIGLALFVLQFFEGPREVILFFAIGAAFLAFYFYGRAYGMLIPGCILVGIGLGQWGERFAFGFENFSAIGLGTGFVAIFVIDRIYRGKTAWWPLIPGGILIAGGIASGRAVFDRVVSKGWPLILVVVGIMLLTGMIGRASRRSGE